MAWNFFDGLVVKTHASTAETMIWSLVGELRTHMLCNEVKKKKKNTTNEHIWQFYKREKN